MSEDQVREHIKTPAVLEAFDKAMLSRLPASIKRAYDEEDHQFDIYSDYTEKFVAEQVAKELAKSRAQAIEKGKTEGLLEGKKEGLLVAALGMKKLQIPTDQIVKATGLSAAEIDGIKSEDLDS